MAAFAIVFIVALLSAKAISLNSAIFDFHASAVIVERTISAVSAAWPPVIWSRLDLGMPRNLSLRRGLRPSFVIAGIVGYLLGTPPPIATYSRDPLSFQNRVVGNLSGSQIPAPSFPDRTASEIVALRFPDLSPSQNVALRFPEFSSLGASSTPKITAASVSGGPAPLVHLINFQVAAALPPLGHSRFCLRYPDDCRVHTVDFRRRNIVLTPQRWSELEIVNRNVNRGIFANVTPGNGVTEEWLISPPSGDCKDYAVTKRHELLARGWPSRALLLSEMVLTTGEHHLVLVVRVKDTDLVLDNLNEDIRVAETTYEQYLWMRIQSPQNPKFWMRVQRRDDLHGLRMALLSN